MTGREAKQSRFDRGSKLILRRRKWQPSPIFSPRRSCGQRSLVGCRLWGRIELDTTEAAQQQQQQQFVPSFVQYFSAFSLFFLNLLCLGSLVFPGFKESLILSLKKVEFFLPFGFCPPKVGPGVCVSFIEGKICAELLFVFPLMGKPECGGNPVCQ